MFHGSITALVTPMLEDGSLDFAGLEKLIELQLANGTNGLVIAGTTGESPTLSDADFVQILSKTIEQVASRVPVIAGTGCNDTRTTVEKTKQAARLGADACLVVTPYYNKPTQEGLKAHYQAVATVGLPVVLYNVPGRTSCDLLPETVIELAKNPNIVAVKDAADLKPRMPLYREQLPKDFAVLSGDDVSVTDCLLHGGNGVVSVSANVIPKAMSALCAKAAADQEDAAALQERLLPLHQALFCESNPIPIKWALAHLGFIRSGIRLPLTKLTMEHQGKVSRALEQVVQWLPSQNCRGGK